MPDHKYPGDTTAKGYGAAHKRLRRAWGVRVAMGLVDCAKCGERIRPGEPWDLGHIPGSQRLLYRGPEHRRCNRGSSGERSTPDPTPGPRTRW